MTGAWIKTPKAARLIFRIYGKTGKDIALLSKNQGEGHKELPVPQLAALSKGEILFAPGTPFKVMAVSRKDAAADQLPTIHITLSEQ